MIIKESSHHPLQSFVKSFGIGDRELQRWQKLWTRELMNEANDQDDNNYPVNINRDMDMDNDMINMANSFNPAENNKGSNNSNNDNNDSGHHNYGEQNERLNMIFAQ